MTQQNEHQTTPPYASAVDIDDDWFHVLKISDRLFAITEPRHYEHTVINLIIGNGRAILIDTGCGIGNISQVVAKLTRLPITVINTHTHLDHLGGNQHFDDIFILDHSRSRALSRDGATQETIRWELFNPAAVTPPWPKQFDLAAAVLPPFTVSRWLADGDVLDIGGVRLKVLHTPGEAPDHICLLDQTHRILFSGDILLDGSVWSHLDGGDVGDLLKSYERLMEHYDDFDFLMPCHNAPCQPKTLLPLALAAAKSVVSGAATWTAGADLWGRAYKKYEFGPLSILTK